jgi:isoquinoline 1-oxidoreductase subunit beta
MATEKKTVGRRAFLKSTTLAGGGMMLGFSWLASACNTGAKVTAPMLPDVPKNWIDFNAYIKISPEGLVTVMSPNPEIGQNVKTSMPMIVAEELDVAWEQIVIEQAALDTEKYKWQIAGGSRSISSSWQPMRQAGASARYMLRQAASEAWQVPLDEVTTNEGMLYHKKSGKSANYGSMATAASKLPVPEKVAFKAVKDFKIIGTSRKNIDNPKIVRGQPLYGIDFKRPGMLIAMLVQPPAFGLQLKSIENAATIKAMPGIKDVITIKTYPAEHPRSAFDINAFNDLAVVVGESTWQVMQAKKSLKCTWEPAPERNLDQEMFGRKSKVRFPVGLESTEKHDADMVKRAKEPAKQVRKDGDPEAMFKNAATVIERTYTTPYWAHNCMEPINFFADVKPGSVELMGGIQTPEIMQKSVAARLGVPLETVTVNMTRMGGGFGRKLYGHYVVEAAVISQKMSAPIKLVYTREDDMTNGIYRPSYRMTYRAAFDAQKKLLAYHVNAGGVPESPLAANRFPAGAIEHYLAEEWNLDSNITTGAFRAPRSNFTASSEQSFLDEVAEQMGRDPIDLRLELFARAQKNPVGKDNGKDNDYVASRYAGVLELVREKSGWDKPLAPGLHRGVAAYYCHNTYVAQVVELRMQNDRPVVERVVCAIDCGVVVNPLAATNLAEGGAVDGIGHALYSEMTFTDGVPDHQNFNSYRLIRHHEAPKKIEVHFVKNEVDPTGLGEPPYPPVMAALANALYKATGKRFYDQPFFG